MRRTGTTLSPHGAGENNRAGSVCRKTDIYKGQIVRLPILRCLSDLDVPNGEAEFVRRVDVLAEITVRLDRAPRGCSPAEAGKSAKQLRHDR
jgi:hypothetical protein